MTLTTALSQDSGPSTSKPDTETRLQHHLCTGLQEEPLRPTLVYLVVLAQDSNQPYLLSSVLKAFFAA